MSAKYIKRIEEGFKHLKKLTNEPIALAISGGPDSMALAWSAQQFLEKKNLKCYLVNHNTNKDSSLMIDKSANYLARQGLDCTILNIHPTEFSEDNLRIMRYNAIEKAIFDDNIKQLVTGHHLDDDLETFLYRLLGQSGLTGLQELLQVCNDNNIPVCIDPSNDDLKYKRNITRDLFKRINDGSLIFDDTEIFKQENFKEVALFYKRIGRLNQLRTDSVLKSYFLPDSDLGIGLLNLPKGEAWLNDEYLACDVLRRVVQFIQPNSPPPRLASLKKFRATLISGIGKSVTIGNCWIRPPQLNSGKDNYMILPAPPQSKLKAAFEVMLTDDKVPKGLKIISQGTSERLKLRYDFIFNDRHLMNVKFHALIGEPLFKDIIQEMENPPKVDRHLEILSLKKYNLKIAFGTDALLGQFTALFRILARVPRARSGMPKQSLTDIFAARKMRGAIQHFAAHTPMHSRSIAVVIVHVDEDGQQYPVAIPSLNVNLIKHACLFDSKYIGDMNYINK